MREDNQNPSFTNVLLTKKTKSLGTKADQALCFHRSEFNALAAETDKSDHGS